MQVLGEIFTTVDLIDGVHFGDWGGFWQLLVVRDLCLSGSLQIEEGNVLVRAFLRPESREIYLQSGAGGSS